MLVIKFLNVVIWQLSLLGDMLYFMQA